MAYEMVMPYHLHMPSYFLETFTEYPWYSHWISLPKAYCIYTVALEAVMPVLLTG